MIYAIASSGGSNTATVDSRFGRCACIALYNTLGATLDFFVNPYKDADVSAGKSIVKWLHSKNVNAIIAGEFGLKIKPELDELQIQMIIIKNTGLRIFEIIEMLGHHSSKSQ